MEDRVAHVHIIFFFFWCCTHLLPSTKLCTDHSDDGRGTNCLYIVNEYNISCTFPLHWFFFSFSTGFNKRRGIRFRKKKSVCVNASPIPRELQYTNFGQHPIHQQRIIFSSTKGYTSNFFPSCMNNSRLQHCNLHNHELKYFRKIKQNWDISKNPQKIFSKQLLKLCTTCSDIGVGYELNLTNQSRSCSGNKTSHYIWEHEYIISFILILAVVVYPTKYL